MTRFQTDAEEKNPDLWGLIFVPNVITLSSKLSIQIFRTSVDMKIPHLHAFFHVCVIWTRCGKHSTLSAQTKGLLNYCQASSWHAGRSMDAHTHTLNSPTHFCDYLPSPPSSTHKALNIHQRGEKNHICWASFKNQKQHKIFSTSSLLKITLESKNSFKHFMTVSLWLKQKFKG